MKFRELQKDVITGLVMTAGVTPTFKTKLTFAIAYYSKHIFTWVGNGLRGTMYLYIVGLSLLLLTI